MAIGKVKKAKTLTKAVFNKLANKKENLGLTKGQFMNRLRMQGYTDREGNLIKRSPNAVSYTHLTLPTILLV